MCFIECQLISLISASDREGSLGSRPGTDYFERQCGGDSSDSQGGRVDSPIWNSVRQEEEDSMSASGSSFMPASAVTEASVSGPRCTFGKLHYEKVTGNELIRASPSRLFSRREGIPGLFLDESLEYLPTQSFSQF